MANFAPEAFGKYYLVDKIAVGGMAEIFKAKSYSHGGFEKLLVIKRILGHLSDNKEFIDMFMDEAKISVALQHPNIVQIYDFGKLRDNYFIAMECVDGRDIKGVLRKLAERRKILPIEFAVYIAHEMCKGLDYAHKRADGHGKCLGIVHRDISPSNILVSYSGEVKVADFGIARAAMSTHDTRAGVLKGKFEYMSPEQAQGKELDPRSDVFATGIILHEMLTGRRLFKTKSEIQTLEKIKAVDVEPPSALNNNVPARLDEIVMRALARDRTDRYADCKAMQGDLLDFMYPATPDLTQESLAHFLEEIFAEEISDERRRLIDSSKIAAALWEKAPDPALESEWPETERTGEGTLRKKPSRAPFALIAVLVCALVGLVAYIAVTHNQGVIKLPIPQLAGPCQKDRGCVKLVVHPGGDDPFPAGITLRAFADGVPIGTGPEIVFDDLPTDKEIVITVEADGYEAQALPAKVYRPGEESTFPIFMIPLAANEVPEQRKVETAGTVMFDTAPPGAEVFVNDVDQGTTPLRWKGGVEGTRYKIRYVLAGFEVEEFDVEYPKANATVDATRTLAPKVQDAKPKGTIVVNCGPAFAAVYLDGKQVADRTPAELQIDEGTHTVATKNPFSGSEDTKQVEVVAGKTKHVTLTCN